MLWKVRRQVHDAELSIASARHAKGELGDGQHFGLVRAALRTQHEQTSVGIAEFYLKDMYIAL